MKPFNEYFRGLKFRSFDQCDWDGFAGAEGADPQMGMDAESGGVFIILDANGIAVYELPDNPNGVTMCHNFEVKYINSEEC